MTWRKGRCDSAYCVEARRVEGGLVEFRSSLRTMQPSAYATDAEFAAFIIQVKNGDFDEFLEARDVS